MRLGQMPLFPGYVFVRLDLRDRLRVLQIPSVAKLVSFNGTPAALPEAETKEWCREILENLGYLLLSRKDQETYRRFQVLGGMRLEQNIPLHEAVLRMHILKNKILGFVHEEALSMTVIQVYAQEELEQRIGQFFDALVYHVVRGYEQASHRAHRVA